MTRPDSGLRHGDLGATARHLCVDMQRLFAEPTDWETPWMWRVLPNVVRSVAAHPERTVFTRFVPAERPGEGPGTWSRYYERWASMTIERIGRDMVDLVPELAGFVPPAAIVDKRIYSPWTETDIGERLRARGVDTLDRKSTRRTPFTNAHLVCRLLHEKKNKTQSTTQHLNKHKATDTYIK